ncbi:TetR/AcrR family transcriptional regulator [Oleiagrimonas sp. C23AA]|uniref:TetR/AcrR family transcriptional regulator n=1 Tax=Oleiagrimonas sp. C23AA TaxID=2719047 RepID=UPI0014229EBA|nr:TetR/AcrR family transcriptional regulator [Oleiagrimonas sp. C23AA]NII12058.1 helix-turn-helix transcriptional regulator [Oleiagrimonas sp. C23AA]
METAVQMLEADGLARFTTNRLAEKSGYSVGTIYQYFDNKQAILDALAQHERERRVGKVREALGDTADGDKVEKSPEAGTDNHARIRKVVRIVLHAFDGRQRARRILIDRALQQGRQQELDGPMVRLANMLTTGEITDPHGHTPIALSETEAFVLTRAVAGVIRAAVQHDPAMLKKRTVEDALVTLIAGFFQARAARSG